MRNKFDLQLEQLHLELIKMGALCEEAISAGVKALLDGDRAMAEKAMQRERDIDQKERDVESLCMKLLLQQQPVASDLRAISAALKMISDMERIGDQASDIAELAQYITKIDLPKKIKIKEMAYEASSMVTDCIDAFVNKDLEGCRKVEAHDDVVDNMFSDIKNEIIHMVQSENVDGEFCVDLLMTAKYLERIADHAVNVAEWVEYSITGVHKGDEEEASE